LNQHEKTASHKSKIDPEFAAVEEAKKDERGQSYFCIACGNGHDFKSRSHLNEHEKTASHKRKIDPEFAAVEEAEKAAEKDERGQSYFCIACGNGHDFKSRSHLNEHEKTASHKSKIDPEFAAVEETKKDEKGQSYFCIACGTGIFFVLLAALDMISKRVQT
jgi:hypothetical protein